MPIRVILALFARYPLLGGVFGLVLASVFGYVGLAASRDLRAMPQEPRRLSLAQAVAAMQSSGQDQWVAIDDVVWDCDNIVQEGDRTAVIFADEARSVLGLATFTTRDLDCYGLELKDATGILRPLGDGEYAHLTSRGFDLSGYGSAAAKIALCTFCGRSNSSAFVVMAAIVVFLGLTMYPMSLWLQKQGYG